MKHIVNLRSHDEDEDEAVVQVSLISKTLEGNAGD
jgi:hypothetical protein